MVDRTVYDFGIGSIGDRSDTGEFRVKESSKKRRRPEVSPHIKDRIASLLPEESSESPVRKFLKQFSYSDPEDMPKNSIKIKPKDEANGLKRTRIRRRWTSSGRESGKRSLPVVMRSSRPMRVLPSK